MYAHNERKRVMGELTAWQTAFIAKMITGESLEVNSINPYAPPVKRRKPTAFENKMGWDNLFRGLGLAKVAGVEGG